MKTLHAYLLREVVTTLGMTVGVFTFFILLASVLKDVLGLLVAQHVSLFMVGKAILLLIPYVMVYALPMGLLTAALLVFGRLSADNEITAVRASGVSLVSLVAPILALSAVLSVVCALITMYVVPQCRVASKNLLREIGLAKATSLIPEKTYIRDFPGAIVYVSHVRGPYLEDVLIYQLKRDKVESYLRADAGEVVFSPTNNLIFIQLTNVYTVIYVEDRSLPQVPFMETAELIYTNTGPRKLEGRPELDNMTFFELRQELKELEAKMSEPLTNTRPVRATATLEERRRAERAMNAQRIDLTFPVRLQMHRQVSFSFACIGFTLVGIPLGIRAHRRETSFGIAMAIVLVLVYYSFVIFGTSLETKPELAPDSILWIPNFLFQVIGSVLLWRANKGV